MGAGVDPAAMGQLFRPSRVPRSGQPRADQRDSPVLLANSSYCNGSCGGGGVLSVEDEIQDIGNLEDRAILKLGCNFRMASQNTGIDEPLDGRDQLANITDDFTDPIFQNPIGVVALLH